MMACITSTRQLGKDIGPDLVLPILFSFFRKLDTFFFLPISYTCSVTIRNRGRDREVASFDVKFLDSIRTNTIYCENLRGLPAAAVYTGRRELNPRRRYSTFRYSSRRRDFQTRRRNIVKPRKVVRRAGGKHSAPPPLVCLCAYDPKWKFLYDERNRQLAAWLPIVDSH